MTRIEPDSSCVPMSMRAPLSSVRVTAFAPGAFHTRVVAAPASTVEGTALNNTERARRCTVTDDALLSLPPAPWAVMRNTVSPSTATVSRPSARFWPRSSGPLPTCSMVTSAALLVPHSSTTSPGAVSTAG
ncbi:MAG: hypothetical protein JNM69_08440 [Archangium sp.]|nr:hypothetical protein [Archangium sp.]